jgi:hypothetical protein
MDEKPYRRRFRFGLICAFVLVAAVGVLACFWNPFHKPNISNLSLIQVGMTEAQVARLLGEPDSVQATSGGMTHVYHTENGEPWLIDYENDRVLFSFPLSFRAVLKPVGKAP